MAQGSFAKIGFSVPNERDDAGTVELRVQLPEDHPLPFVSVQPMPGWEVETTTRTLDEPIDGEGGSITEAVDTVTWRATAALDPDRREAFVLTQLIGLAYAEAAAVAGCPVGTIRSRVARARSDLLTLLGQARSG